MEIYLFFTVKQWRYRNPGYQSKKVPISQNLLIFWIVTNVSGKHHTGQKPVLTFNYAVNPEPD